MLHQRLTAKVKIGQGERDAERERERRRQRGKDRERGRNEREGKRQRGKDTGWEIHSATSTTTAAAAAVLGLAVGQNETVIGQGRPPLWVLVVLLKLHHGGRVQRLPSSALLFQVHPQVTAGWQRNASRPVRLFHGEEVSDALGDNLDMFKVCDTNSG